MYRTNMFDHISLYMSRAEYHDQFKPRFLSNANKDPMSQWLQTRATYIILDFLPESVQKSLYVQDQSYLEAQTSDGEVIRRVGYDTMVDWLIDHRNVFRVNDVQ